MLPRCGLGWRILASHVCVRFMKGLDKSHTMGILLNKLIMT